MKPHIKRVWWEPACCFLWQMEIQMGDGTVGTMQRYELDEFTPNVNPDMAGIYKAAAAVTVN